MEIKLNFTDCELDRLWYQSCSSFVSEHPHVFFEINHDLDDIVLADSKKHYLYFCDSLINAKILFAAWGLDKDYGGEILGFQPPDEKNVHYVIWTTFKIKK